MIHKTGPITLIDLVDRIKELSNDTLLSTISANGQNEKINMIAPLETAGHGDVAFLASPKYREEAKNCKEKRKPKVSHQLQGSFSLFLPFFW